VPAPSQTPLPHDVPAAVKDGTGVSPLHVHPVHSAAMGTSFGFATITTSPLPSHCGRLQSPFVVSASSVPAGE